MTPQATLIVGHGSQDPEGIQEFLQLVELFYQHDPSQIVECGFLEFAQPTIQEGLDRCVERGAWGIDGGWACQERYSQ
jgi:sirohydrochlorin cobaltochelatase